MLNTFKQNMATIAHLAEKLVEQQPYLEEALTRGIINYAALAEELQPQIEKELKVKVKSSAVMMALRRLSERLQKGTHQMQGIHFNESDIMLRSDLCELTVVKTPSSLKKLKSISDIPEYRRGDFFTMTQGFYEVTLITNKRNLTKVEKALDDEKIMKVITHLASVTVTIPLASIETMGFFYTITKALNWNNINIIEIVSTLTEMSFIVREGDAAHAFDILTAFCKG